MHTHNGGAEDHETHGGSRGLGWDLLDSIMLACFVVLASILAEQLYRSWRARRTSGVRYDLTPEGRAAAGGPTGDGEADLAAEAAAAAPEAPAGKND